MKVLIMRVTLVLIKLKMMKIFHTNGPEKRGTIMSIQIRAHLQFQIHHPLPIAQILSL